MPGCWISIWVTVLEEMSIPWKSKISFSWPICEIGCITMYDQVEAIFWGSLGWQWLLWISGVCRRLYFGGTNFAPRWLGSYMIYHKYSNFLFFFQLNQYLVLAINNQRSTDYSHARRDDVGRVAWQLATCRPAAAKKKHYRGRCCEKLAVTATRKHFSVLLFALHFLLRPLVPAPPLLGSRW